MSHIRGIMLYKSKAIHIKLYAECVYTYKVYKKYRERDISDTGNMSNKEWERLYAKGGYGGVGSGPGSRLKNNYKLINWLTDFIKKESKISYR